MAASGKSTVEMGLSRKEQRQRCWAARDEHFACMDENGDKSELCESTKKAFEDVCSAVWVEHFLGVRTQKRRQQRLQELSIRSQKE